MSIVDISDRVLERHRVAMQQQHTKALKPGWYVLTGFFWHDDCSVVAGPFSTQEDATTCRTAMENSEGHRSYYIDEVTREDNS